MAMQSVYSKTYTSFAGSDIVATFNGRVIGELQAITFSVTREKAPIYTMGSPDPRSFSRGKRGIAGSLVFSVFDRDAFKQLKNDSDIWTQYANTSDGSYRTTDAISVNKWDDIQEGKDFVKVSSVYADQIPPFDITITFHNEYGQSAKMAIYGVEILNEGMGMSVDDITTEKACTYVARALEHIDNE